MMCGPRLCPQDQPQRAMCDLRDKIIWQMKRFNGTEFAGLALSVILFLGGASMVIWPRAEIIPRNAVSGSRLSSGVFEEHISESGARTRGAMAIVLGTGLAAFIIYRKNP